MTLRVLFLTLLLGGCASLDDGGAVWPYPEPPSDDGAYREAPPSGEPNGAGETAPGVQQSTARSASVQSLVDQADRELAGGNPEQAAATLERAIRIDGSDPLAWLRLAQVRFEQGNLIQAENLARRSLSYADSGPTARDAWLLIADIKTLQGDQTAASDARRQAFGG